MWNLRFHNKFVFRSPAYPFSEEIISIDVLKKNASDSKFSKAIYVSSPALHSEMQRWLKDEIISDKDKQKLQYSLNKYLSRIRTRCTPYGLFAGCSTGNWDETSEIELTSNLKSHTRPDMDFFCRLIQNLSEQVSIKPFLIFYPNNSVYVMGDELRYIEYKYVGEERIHTIKSIDKSQYALKILNAAKAGMLLSDLEKLLVDIEITATEAHTFIEEMVKAQLLVSELEPAVTGEEFMQPLIKILQRIHKQNKATELGELLTILNNINERIRALDDTEINNIQSYLDLMAELKHLKITTNEKNLLQVDGYYNPITAKLNRNLQERLLKAVGFLKKMTQPFQNNDLNNFKKTFYNTYEGRELPLLEVLDQESGIGYPNKDQVGVNPLVAEFVEIQQAVGSQGNLNYRDQFLIKKLLDVHKKGETIVNFKDDDLKDFPNQSDSNTTITMSIMFRLIDAQEGKMQLSFVGGNSSAANLLGRFAHGDKEIHSIIKDIIVFEKEVMKDKILAEIVHLPKSRLGNILLRPIFREYEIPYLGKSALSKEFQIPLDDIMISVKESRIILRSKRLNKEILPRLSTAHNFSSPTSLPVYKFLGDIQLQDVNMPALFFSWGGISKAFKFLPRVEYEGVVLFPATWNLNKTDYDILLKNINSTSFVKELNNWRENWKMPRHILLKDADNELDVDFESELSIKSFLDAIKRRDEIEVVEFLFDTNSALVHDTNGDSYTNEIIAILFNDDYSPKKRGDNNLMLNAGNTKIANKTLIRTIKRSFATGSEWLYYKIYCGVKTSDKILIKIIKPLVEELTRKGLIKKWFFIRYADPDFHIRLRLYNNDIEKIGEIIKIVHNYFSPKYEQGMISKIMNDTYIRELERYGNNTMEITEEYFMLESSMALTLLSNTLGENGEDIKLYYTLRSTDALLDAFNFSPGEKVNYMEFLKNNFINEHGGHKELKLRLDAKYRTLRKTIEDILSKRKDTQTSSFVVTNLLNIERIKLMPIIDNILHLYERRYLEMDMKDLIASYLHMNINRIFMGKQRTYEMVIYDFLYRYYKSALARDKQSIHKI